VPFTRWDSLRDLLALHEQLGQLVGADAPGWTPAVDLYETAQEFVLTAELPGLSRQEIDIHAEEFRIMIRGARGTAHADLPCEQYHRVERGHGRFSRAFALPQPIAVDRVSADLKDGILTVIMPKSGVHPGRSIVFVGFTAEESGLLGSQALIAKPPMPLSRIAAILNMDVMNLYGKTRDVSALGLDQSSLGAVFTRAAAAEGLRVSTNRDALIRGGYFRSDRGRYWPCNKRSVKPAMLLATFARHAKVH